MKHAQQLLIVVATALLAACGNRADSVAPLTASAIAIAAPDGAIPVTGTTQFAAVVTDANGHTLTTSPTWTVVNGGGTITSDGLFTAGDSTGTFLNTIVATIGSVSATSSITVSAGALANILVAPAADTIVVDAAMQFTATGTDAFGHSVAIPAGLVWAVSSPTAGTVDTSGHFSAGSVAGTYSITATSGAIVGHGSILVVAGPLFAIVVSPTPDTLVVNATTQFTAVGTDVHGNAVAVTPVWSVLNCGVMGSDGLFTAGTVAETCQNTVLATSGSIVGLATVTVLPGALASIVVRPSTAFMVPNGSRTFSASGRDAYANTIAIVPSWSVTTSLLGTIASFGELTASSSALGTYSNAVIATSGSITGTASVVVCSPSCSPP